MPCIDVAFEHMFLMLLCTVIFYYFRVDKNDVNASKERLVCVIFSSDVTVVSIKLYFINLVSKDV